MIAIKKFMKNMGALLSCPHLNLHPTLSHNSFCLCGYSYSKKNKLSSNGYTWNWYRDKKCCKTWFSKNPLLITSTTLIQIFILNWRRGCLDKNFMKLTLLFQSKGNNSISSSNIMTLLVLETTCSHAVPSDLHAPTGFLSYKFSVISFVLSKECQWSFKRHWRYILRNWDHFYLFCWEIK